MGQTPSQAARDDANKAKDDLDSIVLALENKLEAFELEVLSKRGLDNVNNSEVIGGRSVMRISDIRIATNTGLAENLKAAVGDFFNAAQNSVQGGANGDQKAKRSAVKGAEKLILGGLSAILGVSNGQAKTKKSFIVLFMNNAFVRVDYYVYSYSVSAAKFGVEAGESGCCYLADLSVLETAQLQPQEIDFLLSQALSASIEELPILNKIKFALIESSILGRALIRQEPPLTFEELGEIAKELAKSSNVIDEAFAELEDLSPLPEPVGAGAGADNVLAAAGIPAVP